MLAVCRGREAVRLAGGGGVKKHIFTLTIDHLQRLEGVGPRCLVVKHADRGAGRPRPGALTVAADTLTLTHADERIFMSRPADHYVVLVSRRVDDRLIPTTRRRRHHLAVILDAPVPTP